MCLVLYDMGEVQEEGLIAEEFASFLKAPVRR